MAYDPYQQAPPKYQTAEAVPVGYNAQQQQLAPVYGQPAAPQQQMFSGDVAEIKDGEGGNFQFLSHTNRFLVKQRFEVLEAIASTVGFDAVEFSNKYDILDANTGEPILYAAEESSCLCRTFCKPSHEAKLHIFDVRSGTPVPILRMEKPFKCNCCIALEICQQSQKTYTHDGKKLGGAKQTYPCGGGFVPRVRIEDENGSSDMFIEGPCCIIGGGVELCFNFDFKFKDKNNNKIGKFKHMKAGGMMEGLQQAAGDADNYLLELKENVGAIKAANLIGTLLLLDYMFFEGGSNCDLLAGTINICNIYCCGCVCPLSCDLSGGGGEGGGDFE